MMPLRFIGGPFDGQTRQCNLTESYYAIFSLVGNTVYWYNRIWRKNAFVYEGEITEEEYLERTASAGWK